MIGIGKAIVCVIGAAVCVSLAKPRTAAKQLAQLPRVASSTSLLFDLAFLLLAPDTHIHAHSHTGCSAPPSGCSNMQVMTCQGGQRVMLRS